MRGHSQWAGDTELTNAASNSMGSRKSPACQLPHWMRARETWVTKLTLRITNFLCRSFTEKRRNNELTSGIIFLKTLLIFDFNENMKL